MAYAALWERFLSHLEPETETLLRQSIEGALLNMMAPHIGHRDKDSGALLFDPEHGIDRFADPDHFDIYFSAWGAMLCSSTDMGLLSHSVLVPEGGKLLAKIESMEALRVRRGRPLNVAAWNRAVEFAKTVRHGPMQFSWAVRAMRIADLTDAILSVRRQPVYLGNRWMLKDKEP